MHSYASKIRHATIRIKAEEPDFSALSDDPNTWDQSIYRTVKEEVLNDSPKLLGKFVATTHHDDNNLFHDFMTG